jgi:peptidoglycan/LPS O-acetylase OafA/YrhL
MTNAQQTHPNTGRLIGAERFLRSLAVLLVAIFLTQVFTALLTTAHVQDTVTDWAGLLYTFIAGMFLVIFLLYNSSKISKNNRPLLAELGFITLMVFSLPNSTWKVGIWSLISFLFIVVCSFFFAFMLDGIVDLE